MAPRSHAEVFYSADPRGIYVSRSNSYKIRPYFATPARLERLTAHFRAVKHKRGFYFYPKPRISA